MQQGITRYIRYLVTLGAVAVAGYTVSVMFEEYLFHPWTRDGHVRAQVVRITPRISGPIVELPIKDNQAVRKGDLLFKIDPRTYALAVEQAEAKLKQARASALVSLDQATPVNCITATRGQFPNRPWSERKTTCWYQMPMSMSRRQTCMPPGLTSNSPRFVRRWMAMSRT
jgi:hypothetical protein